MASAQELKSDIILSLTKLNNKNLNLRNYSLSKQALTFSKLKRSKGKMIIDKSVNLVITQYSRIEPEQSKTLHKQFTERDTYGFCLFRNGKSL